ncbi:MAG: tetratricopeptide repeat protein [Myxococcota bacterium]
MSTDRVKQLERLVKAFPDSPMGHFSLGKYYLDAQNWSAAVKCMEEAVRLDPHYAAAWVALGDAAAGGGDSMRAKEAYRLALKTPHGTKDASLAADIERRLAEL